MDVAPVDMTTEECLEMLEAGSVGRVAMSTPMGPRIVPVEYVVQEHALILCTTPYSELGTYGVDTVLAFEVDALDDDGRLGGSVTALGRSSRCKDADLVSAVRDHWEGSPWLTGRRYLYLQLRWRELTGRRLGSR